MPKQKRRFFKEEDMTVCLGNKDIYPSRTKVVLGIVVHQNLSWKSHLLEGCEIVRGKTNRCLGQLWRLANNCTMKQKLTVNSRFTYGAALWGSELTKTINKIQVSQNLVARWVLKAGR